MSLHPSLLAVTALDLAGMVCLAIALAGAIRVLLGWRAEAPTREQLTLERLLEEVSALGRLGLALHSSAAVVLLLALNHVLSGRVPGAMCGVGVLQAMPGGVTALGVRGISLAMLAVWLTMDALYRGNARGALAVASSRSLLVAVPVAAVAAWQTWHALDNVDVHRPVSCCAAVYDLAAARGDPSIWPGAAGPLHAVLMIAAGVSLGVGALAVRRRARVALPLTRVPLLPALAATAWSVLASWTLVDVFGPYLYGVLGHRCPLCFFLPEHYAVGYPIAAALVLIVAEALATSTAILAASRDPSIEEQARLRVRKAGSRVALGVVVFVLLVAGPAVVWRMRWGVWI